MTYREYNGHHSRNFYCRVWSRIKILISSCKSYDHMSPLEGRVHHIDYMFIHLSCMHQVESRVPQISFATPDWKKMMGNEERGQSEAHCQKEVESIDGEVARLTFAWTSVEHQIEGLEQVLSIKWIGNVRIVLCGLARSCYAYAAQMSLPRLTSLCHSSLSTSIC
jgi:hypothetical protein